MIYTPILEPKSIVLYLARKGTNATAIRQDSFAALDRDTVSNPTVTRVLRDTLLTARQLLTQELAVESDPSPIDLAITQVLTDEPFASFRQLASRTCFPKSTVHCHLVNIFGFTTTTYLPQVLYPLD
jgi:hypothetical protein